MTRRAWTSFVFLLASASITQAGAFIELVPDNPGPYFGGEDLLVELNIHNGDPVDRFLRLIQWDLSATDAAITLVGDFEFELPFGGLVWAAFPAYPLPSAIVLTLGPLPAGSPLLFFLPHEGATRSGWLDLTLPNEPGSYTLDVLNADSNELNRSTLLVFGYGGPGDPVTNWRGDGLGDDLLTGGQFIFHVVPEPASMWLLAAGSVFVARRTGCQRRDRP